jgi:hypothetical protein
VFNADQANRNGEIIDLPSFVPFDDVTNADTLLPGDACNPDVDNDGLTSAQELAAGTNASLADTDGDRRLDGPEVACGSNPLLVGSVPGGADSDGDRLPDTCESAAGTNPAAVDSDADGTTDEMEYLRHGTDPLLRDTDGDGCRDAIEIATLNDDHTVNSQDLATTAQSYGPATGPRYHLDFDRNRDGVINSADLMLVATQFGPCAP